MTDVHPDQRGVVSGMLNLSRNLCLSTGASVMGAVFALASGTSDIMTARAEAVAAGLRTTCAVAAALIVVALAIASATQTAPRRSPRSVPPSVSRPFPWSVPRPRSPPPVRQTGSLPVAPPR